MGMGMGWGWPERERKESDQAMGKLQYNSFNERIKQRWLDIETLPVSKASYALSTLLCQHVACCGVVTQASQASSNLPQPAPSSGPLTAGKLLSSRPLTRYARG